MTTVCDTLIILSSYLSYGCVTLVKRLIFIEFLKVGNDVQDFEGSVGFFSYRIIQAVKGTSKLCLKLIYVKYTSPLL